MNSKNYSFGAVVIDLIMDFVEANRSVYEPAILIGTDGPDSGGGGVEIAWGDPKGQYYIIRIYTTYVDLDSTLLVSGPGSASLLTHDIKQIKEAISLIKTEWYK